METIGGWVDGGWLRNVICNWHRFLIGSNRPCTDHMIDEVSCLGARLFAQRSLSSHLHLSMSQSILKSLDPLIFCLPCDRAQGCGMPCPR